MTMIRASTVEEVQEAVRTHPRLRPIAGRTKPALWAGPAAHDDAPQAANSQRDVRLLDVSGLAGIIDYQPAECTFTAWAGTRLADVETMLAADGLHLPFDPPFSGRGATLGGTVAAGLSGPGRFRYGGVRDFLLGARIVDGDAHLVRGGGRVVKNAAGFYLQNLLLGSFGRLGVLIDLTFKVFPTPQARVTLVAECGTLDSALDTLVRLRQSTFEIEALDLDPPGTLSIRLGGLESALDARVSALMKFLSSVATNDSASLPIRLAGSSEADATWRAINNFDWIGDATLVKVAITPSRIVALDSKLAEYRDEQGSEILRRYSAGGEVAWIAWPGPIDILDALLGELALPGLILTEADAADTADVEPLIGVRPDPVFLGRVRAALDPRGVFA